MSPRPSAPEPARRRSAGPLSPPSRSAGPLCDLACAVHVHSTHSDGTGTVAQIAGAARASGTDVVLLSDHHVLTARERGEEGWHGGALVLVGQEVSPPNKNHTLAFGIEETIDHRGLSPAGICAAVREQGGLAFAAHPFSTGNPRFPQYGTGMPFKDLEAPDLHGVELWSFLSDAGEAIRGWGDVARFVADPGSVFDHPPARNLAVWDRLCARRPIVALAGLDAHQHGVRVRGRVPLRFVGYARQFRHLRTHVLCERPPNGELDHDRAQVLGALRAGRCYLAVDALASPAGFAFWAESPGSDGDLLMGAEAAAGPWTLRARTPRAADLRLLRDGVEVARAHGQELGLAVEGPGVFRVEARLTRAGRVRTWIVSNPIYLRERGDGLPVARVAESA